MNYLKELKLLELVKDLNNSGSISHKDAKKKAEDEYEKYRVIQDQKYISSMDKLYNRYLEESDLKRE